VKFWREKERMYLSWDRPDRGLDGMGKPWDGRGLKEQRLPGTASEEGGTPRKPESGCRKSRPSETMNDEKGEHSTCRRRKFEPHISPLLAFALAVVFTNFKC
jgi:hypothetical protein